MAKIRTLVQANLFLLVVFSFLFLVCSQRHAGFLMLIVAVPVVIYQVLVLLISWRDTAKRAKRVFAIVIVLAATLLMLMVHLVHHNRSRAEANAMVVKIEQFHAVNGRYPGALSEIGVKDNEAKLKMNLHYFNKSGDIALIYYATFVPFEQWSYDFRLREWEYIYD